MKEVRLALFEDPLEYRFAGRDAARALRPVPVERLLAEARSVDAARCQRLVLTGGSPLLHPRFVALARECRALGFRRMAVETPADPLGRPNVLKTLADLGLEEIVAVLGGADPAAHEAVLGERGTFDAALAGLAGAVAFSAAGGPKVYVVLPVVRPSLDGLDALADRILALPGRLTGLLLSLPEAARVPPGRRDLLVPYGAQAEVAARVFGACVRHGVEYGFSSRRGILPCAAAGAPEHFGTFFHERIQFLAHPPADAAPETFVRIPACEACALPATCAGVELDVLDLFGPGGYAPVPLEVAMTWKLRRTNRLEEFEYHNVSQFKNDSSADARGLLRVNGRCNMACAFCFVDHSAPDFELEELKREVTAMAEGGTKHFVVSGGEPTLHEGLVELIRHARSLGVFHVIEMQSNGVRCADPEYARSLVDAGLNRVTMSLHCADPEHSDRITRLAGGFAKTVRAMHNLRALGVLTQGALVITRENYRELPETVRFLRREFPADGGYLSICLAVAQGISDLVLPWVIPTFTEIRPFVVEALDYCLETGVGFGGMIGQGGYPPCMLGGDLRYYSGPVLEHVFTSENSDEEFYKAGRCRECSFDPYCLGPRRSYVRHYGDAEIRPFRAEIPRVRWTPSAPGGTGAGVPSDLTPGLPAHFDVEEVAMAAGLKPASRVTVEPGEADEAAERARERGLHVERRGPVSLAGRSPVVLLYLSRDPALALGLAEAETPLVRPGEPPSAEEAAAAHARLGRLLGFPACCVDAFCGRLRRGAEPAGASREPEPASGTRPDGGGEHEDFVAAEEALRASGRLLGRLNDLSSDRRVRLVTFYPCRYDCPAAADYAGALFAAAKEADPASAAALRSALLGRFTIASDGTRVGAPRPGSRHVALEFREF